MKSIFLISGIFDSGKTSRMIEIFNDLPKGKAEGFACVKIYNNQNDAVGYVMRRLSTNEDRTFIIDKKFYGDTFEHTFDYERFVFSKSVLNYVSDVIENAMQDSNINSLFLDEIGKLELLDLGFSELLKKMIRSDKDLYLCVNERHIGEISNKFGIKQYRCI